MTIEEMLVPECVSVNARRVIVYSLDAECERTKRFEDGVSDGSEIAEAAYDDDGNAHPWYMEWPVIWIQVEDGALVIEVDEEE